MIADTLVRPPAEPGAMTVEISDGCPLPAMLEWPAHPSGFVMVLEAGRERTPTRTGETLAAELRRAGFGTLVVTSFSLPALVQRATGVAEWLGEHPVVAGLPLGFLGIGAAAPAALAAASERALAEAVVVCGGAPDGVGEALAGVITPTLVLMRAADQEALERSHRALGRLGGIKRLVALREGGPSRTEAGMLAEAGRWAAAWFVRHLAMERTWRGDRTLAPLKAPSGAF